MPSSGRFCLTSFGGDLRIRSLSSRRRIRQKKDHIELGCQLFADRWSLRCSTTCQMLKLCTSDVHSFSIRQVVEHFKLFGPDGLESRPSGPKKTEWRAKSRTGLEFEPEMRPRWSSMTQCVSRCYWPSSRASTNLFQENRKLLTSQTLRESLARFAFRN